MIAETLEYFVIAFISSAVLIVLSKIILQNLIRRPADYYLAEDLKQEEMMLNSAGLSITEEIETNPEGEMTSEHISVTPRFTVDEAVDMHLIERENIPDRFIEEGDHIKQSDDDAGEGSDKAGSDNDSIPEMDELREIILGSSREDAATEGVTESAAADADDKSGRAPKTKKDHRDKKDQKEKTEKTEKTDSTETRNKADKEKKEKKNTDKEKKQEKSKGQSSRKPSMKMRKDELLAIAAERGIDLPEKITKKEILELINAGESASKQNRKKTGNKQDRNKNRNDQSLNKNGNKRNRNKKRDSDANKNNNKSTEKKQEEKQNLKKNPKKDQKQEK